MIRFLVMTAYLMTLVGSLGAEAIEQTDPARTDLVLRIPTKVDENRVVSRNGELELVTYADLRNTCESFDGYKYTVAGHQILIDSYVEVTRDRFCAEIYRDGLRREYRIKGLDSRTTYRIFFRDDQGGWNDYGTTRL